MKLIIKYCLILTVLFNTSLLSQNEIFIINSKDTTEKKSILDASEISIVYYDTIGVFGRHKILKYFESFTELMYNDSTFKIEPVTVSLYDYEHIGILPLLSIDFYEPTTHYTEFKTSDIYSLSYYAKSRDYFSVIAYVSALTTFIVSPLISIDYKGKGFNNDLYYKTAGISSGIMIISIGITLNIKDKIIRVGNYLEDDEKDYWIIKQ